MANEIRLAEQANTEDQPIAEQWLAYASEHAIVHDEASYQWAVATIRALDARAAHLESKRKSWTAALTNIVRDINATVRPSLSAYDRASRALRAKVAEYTLSLRTSREEQARALIPVSAPATAEGVSVTPVTKFEITDPDQVSREFCSPDPRKIQAHVDNGGLLAIRGVRFYTEGKVTVRK